MFTIADEPSDITKVEKSIGAKALGASFIGAMIAAPKGSGYISTFYGGRVTIDGSKGYVPGLAGVPAARSTIGLVDGQAGELFFRGYPIAELAEHSTFEEVAFLLLKGTLPTASELEALKSELGTRRGLSEDIIATLRTLPRTGHPMDALVAGLAAAGMAAPSDLMALAESRWSAAVELLAIVPSIVAAFDRIRRGLDPVPARADLGHAASFLYQLSGKAPEALVERVFDVALILHAEHGVNASTFSARVTGSTLGDPYGVLCAAVMTLAGPLHGGANENVLRMLEGLPDDVDAKAWVADRLAAKDKISGFGHRVYKVKDPRATILQKLVGQVFDRFGTTPIYDLATRVELAMEEAVGNRGIYPNVDFYSGIVYEKLGIKTDLFTPIFAISRTSGWLAHWLEQLEGNRIFRPTQIYEGERGVSYVPIADR